VHPAGVLNPKQTDSPLNLAGGGRCCPVPDLPLLLGPAEPFPFAADLFPLRLAAAFGSSSVFFFSLASILSHLNSNKICYVTKCRHYLLKPAFNHGRFFIINFSSSLDSREKIFLLN
jgi:hypothetical protein